jgi:hypothetical protein
VGRKSDATLLLNKRSNDRRVSAKMPQNLRAAPVRFGEIEDAVTEEFTQAHHQDSRNIQQQLSKLKLSFENQAVPVFAIRPVVIWSKFSSYWDTSRTNDGAALGLQRTIPQRGERSDRPATGPAGIFIDTIALADISVLIRNFDDCYGGFRMNPRGIVRAQPSVVAANAGSLNRSLASWPRHGRLPEKSKRSTLPAEARPAE